MEDVEFFIADESMKYTELFAQSVDKCVGVEL